MSPRGPPPVLSPLTCPSLLLSFLFYSFPLFCFVLSSPSPFLRNSPISLFFFPVKHTHTHTPMPTPISLFEPCGCVLDVKSRRNHLGDIYQFSGEHRPFRGNFRPNHDELVDLQGINLFVSLSTTTFLFVSPNFIEY